MPVTKSAKKALRQSKKKAVVNSLIIRRLKKAIKTTRTKPTKKALSQVFKLLDQASKKKVIHSNKAARLKSRLTKLALKKE